MDLLRRALRDIAAGHTRGLIGGQTAYIRHLSYADQVDYDERRETFLAEAREAGLPSADERLADLKRLGLWSDAKEKAINDARVYVDSLREGQRKNNHMPSMVKQYAQRIADAEKDYLTKDVEKRRLLGLTCEVSAEHEVNDYYIVTNLFKDPHLTVPLYPDSSSFEYMRDHEVDAVVADYNRAMDGCSERNIRKLGMQAWFQRAFQLTGDDYTRYFGKPIVALTFYQGDLLRAGAHFRSIYSSHDITQFPKNVMEDPDLLTEYATAATRKRDELQNQGAYEAGTVVVGAGNEDAKVLGIKSANPMREIMGQFGGNVMDWAAKKGA